jgi:hypothetical protein
VRRQAQFRYYTCDHPGVQRILKTLSEIFEADPDRTAQDVADSSERNKS